MPRSISAAPLYDSIGIGYAGLRKPDPRIAALLQDALGNCSSVLNVGAGAGSYEPAGLLLVAVEPSHEMIVQRPRGGYPAVQAMAEALPFSDKSFAAALAVLTVHHWSDRASGLAELVRVARDRVVILTFDADLAPPFWLVDRYFPAIGELDRRQMAPMEELEASLGPIDIRPVPIPHDCTDGFMGAYWRQPHAYLNPEVRRAISAFTLIGDLEDGLRRLRADLADGTWKRLYGHLLSEQELDLGYRLVIAS
jgi:SAM-dependent methyltransferase